MNCRILLTGSEGLIGRALRASLEVFGVDVAGLDIRGADNEAGDVRDAQRVQQAVTGRHGIVHLAAVSRVVWGERDPETCREVNIGGLRSVIAAARSQTHRPWLVFASSREVYGQPDRFPVAEDAPLQPINVYGHTKVEGEQLIRVARNDGLRTAVVRLSNVYGSTRDHPDRVVPAFARNAVVGDTLRVEGADHSFDFTHIDDVVRGIASLIRMLANGKSPPPIHLLTGRSLTLGELATLAVELARTEAPIVQAPPRLFDASHFRGDPSRALQLLGWTPRVSFPQGLARLIRDFRGELDVPEYREVAP